VFLVIWLLCGIAGTSAAKGFYSHYFIQLLPVLCVTVCWVVLHFGPGMATWSRGRIAVSTALFLLMPGLAAGATYLQALRPIMTITGHRIALHPDTASLIAQEIANSPSGGGTTLYDFDYDIIVYSLSGTRLPTRYVFPMFLSNCFFARVSGVDARKEEARILATDPEFIVRSVPPAPSVPPLEQSVYAQLEDAVAARYVVDRHYDGAVLYRRRADAGHGAATAEIHPASCPKPAD
jgi:hypothetical protein